MTDRQPTHRLCPVCMNAFCPATQARCDDCAIGYTANRGAPTTPTAESTDFSALLQSALDGPECQPESLSLRNDNSAT